jgi:kynureninase
VTSPQTPDSVLTLSARATALDEADPLADRRGLFDLPDGVVYLDGNSLGARPRSVMRRVEDVLRREWGTDLIASWDATWWTLPQRVGEHIAPLLGAAKGQVVVGDSTSVNAFKLLVAAARMRPGRRRIVVDDRTFPTNGYLAESVGDLLDLDVVRADPSMLESVLDEQVAVVMLNHVDFKNGDLWDLPALTQQVHACGALVMWDVCHSVGVVPLAFDADGVDLAVGCTYKFLNGGPGAPAFVYVRREHQADFDQPLHGWHGHAHPFGMQPGYVPADGIVKARVGTPDVLSMAAMDAALGAYDGVSAVQARAKTASLTAFFIEAVDALIPTGVVEVVTPRDPNRRAGQVSLSHPDGRGLTVRLAERGVITDFREPTIVRFGFSPLYVRHVDALVAATALRDMVV